MERLGKPIWIHPARGANHPDYLSETKSLYEIWWTFGWSYETAAAMARLVFSKTLDRHPDLKLIVHHFGGIVPMLEGRIGPGWDQLGVRTSDEDYQALKRSLSKRPLDYFKQGFYADTAVFGSDAATVCGLAFYPHDRVVFASDCPFDPERGRVTSARRCASSIRSTSERTNASASVSEISRGLRARPSCCEGIPCRRVSDLNLLRKIHPRKNGGR